MANQNIDTLNIKITSDAQSANRSINTLIGNLTKLSSALNALSNNRGLDTLAQGTEALGTALAGLKGTDGRTFNSLAKSLTKISSVNSAGLSSLATALSQIGTTLNGLNLGDNTTKITELSKSISQLGYKSVSGAIENIPKLASAMRELLQTLSEAPNVSENVLRLVEALAKLTSSLTAMNRTSVSTTRLTSGFQRLAHNASGLKNAFSKFGSEIKNVGQRVLNFSTKEEQASKSTSSFARNVGLLYARFWALLHLLKGLGSAITSAMNYLETVNYFNKAFESIAENSTGSWSEAGYDSADEYYNSFKERATELNKKLTGYTINAQGLLESTGTTSLGLNPTDTLKYQSLFAQMANSMGVASEQSMQLSEALTKLGADLASVKDMDFEDVWQDMASGMAGMSRTLDKYGVNIRNANLQTKLAELGIDATVSSLSQADKAMLRTIVLIDSTKYAWGDLAETINTPANQIRILKSNLETLAKMLGSLFLPIIKKILPYVNGLVIALQRLVMAIARLFGIDLSEFTSATGTAGDDVSDLVDDTDDLTDGLEDADEEAKKLKNHLLGIDELNILNESDSSSDTDASDVTDQLADALADALADYNSIWDEAFEKLENMAQKIADLIEAWAKKVFEPIKEAWEAVCDYIKERWEHLKTALAELFKAIASDWAEVWAEANTEKIFEALFKTLGNILEIIANIADKFREAWQEGEKGKKILEGLRDIALIIAEHIEYWSKSLADFTAKLDFNPIFESFLNLVEAIRDNLDDVLGILDDFLDFFVEPALKYFIEEFLPRMVDGFADFVNKIDWAGLRESLRDIFDALERIGEVLGGWLLTGLEKLEDIVANMVNSGFFKQLANDLQDLAKGLESASSLGEVLNAVFDFGDSRVESFTNFINSVIDGLNNFFDTLNTIDPNTGEKPIDTIGKRLGGLINTFVENFNADSAGELVNNVAMTILNLISSAIEEVNWVELGMKIGEMLQNLNWEEILLKAVQVIIQAIGALFKAWLGIMLKDPISGGIIAGIALIKVTGLQTSLLNKLSEAFTGETLTQHVGNLIKNLFTKGGEKAGLGDVFKKLLGNATESAGGAEVAEAGAGGTEVAEAGGALTGVAGVVKTIGGVLATVAGTIMAIVNFIKMWKEGFDGIHEVLMVIGVALAGVGAVLLGAPALVVAIVAGIVAGIATLAVVVHDNWDAIVNWWQSDIVPWFEEAGQNIGDFFTKTIPDAIGDLGEWFAEKWDTVKETTSEKWDEIKQTVGEKLNQFRETVKTKWDGIKSDFDDFVTQWREKISQWAQDKWDEITTKIEEVRATIAQKWEELKQNFTDFIAEWRLRITDWATSKWDEIQGKIEEVRTYIKERWDEIKVDFGDFIQGWREKITEWAESKWEDITDKVEEIRAKVKEKWEEMRQNFDEHIEAWREQISKWAQEKWDEVTDKIDELKQNIDQRWEELKTAFAEFVQKWQEKIAEWAQMKWDEVTSKMQEIKEQISEKWDEIKSDFDAFISEWKDKLHQWATEKWDEVVQTFNNLKTGIKEKWDAIKNEAQSSWDTIKSNLKTYANNACDGIKSAFDALPDKLKGIWESISSSAKGAFDGIKSTVSSIVSNLNTAVSNAKSSLSSAYSTAKEWASEKVSSAKSTISNTVSTISSTKSSVVSKVSSALSSASSTIKSAYEKLKSSLSSKKYTYATGGFPEDGMFFANHSELVGQFSNGKTVVANNQQITQGIADATYSAFVRANNDSNSREEELLQQLISAVKQGSKIVIDGREIVTAYDTRKARNGYAF